MTVDLIKRIRWGVRAVLVLGVVVSVVANVLHARDNIISQCIAAWPPLALLLTVELISRVPVHTKWLARARIVATATIAGIAAWVSYWHMAGVAARYGETDVSAHLMPLSVDGLVVVASICLVELGGRIRASEPEPVRAPEPPAALAAPPAVPSAPVFLPPLEVPGGPVDEPEPETPAVDETQGHDGVRDLRSKPQIESAVRALKAQNPDWGYGRISEVLMVPKSRVGTILRTPRPPAEPARMNGHKVLEEVSQ